jgi:hypothetical protein
LPKRAVLQLAGAGVGGLSGIRDEIWEQQTQP